MSGLFDLIEGENEVRKSEVPPKPRSPESVIAYFVPAPVYAPDQVRQAHHRVTCLIAVFAFCFAVIALRLVDVMLLNGVERVQKAERPSYDEMAQPIMTRADIVDRNGVLLATNLVTTSVYANPQEVVDAEDAAHRLSEVVEDSESVLRQRLSSERRFVWIQRNVTPQQAYAINHMGIPGVYFERSEHRSYPQGGLTSHVLGYVNEDNQGAGGIELGIEPMIEKLATEGKSLELSIDIRVQHILSEELSIAQKRYDAKAATGVVLDVNTGEVLAMTSLPEFNPHYAGQASPDALFNRATLGVYEMGSTFKSFTMAKAFDRHAVSFSDGFDATNPIRQAGFTIRDSHGKRRWLSVPEIYMYSSNIGTVKLAQYLGLGYQKEFLEQLGMLEPLDIEIPERGRPLAPDKWRDIRSMTAAYGHGISVTPLHLVRGTSALINGGMLRPITFLKQNAETLPEGKRVIESQASDKMRALMRLTVMKGTGKKADVPGYAVGGKTGSAEKAGAGGYNRKALLSSFIAAFPMDNPKYLVLGILDEPKGNSSSHGEATGGWTVAPAVANVITRIGPILGVTPDSDYDSQPMMQQIVHQVTHATDKAHYAY